MFTQNQQALSSAGLSASKTYFFFGIFWAFPLALVFVWARVRPVFYLYSYFIFLFVLQARPVFAFALALVWCERDLFSVLVRARTCFSTSATYFQFISSCSRCWFERERENDSPNASASESVVCCLSANASYFYVCVYVRLHIYKGKRE